MSKKDISLPSCVVTGQRLCISLKDFVVYFPSTRFNFLLALILKLFPHFTESFHFSFHLALVFHAAVWSGLSTVLVTLASRETWVFLLPEALAFKITLSLLHLGARYYGLRASTVGGCIMLAEKWRQEFRERFCQAKRGPLCHQTPARE